MSTALVALVAGAIGAGVTGVLQLRRDRVETLRQRQLDAADAFASAATLVIRAVSDWRESLPPAATAEYAKQWGEEKREEWRDEGRRLGLSLAKGAREVAAHGPRIELLFGVRSSASVAAMQTIYELLQLTKNLKPHDEEALDRAALAYNLAVSSSARFHDEANVVIASSWWRRVRHRPMRDETAEELQAALAAASDTD